MDEREILKKMVREARLGLTPEEEEQLMDEVAGLLENVKVLAAWDVEEGKGRTPVRPEDLRPDVPGEPLDRDAAVRNAPDAGDGYIAVPKVITEGDDG